MPKTRWRYSIATIYGFGLIGRRFDYRSIRIASRFLTANPHPRRLAAPCCTLCGQPLSIAEQRLKVTAHFPCICLAAFGPPKRKD